jgi:hypothetical protein
MSTRWLTALLILFLINARAEAQTLYVDGTPITIRAIRGYCNNTDPAVLDALERLAVRRKPIAISAPCEDLHSFETGARDNLQRYIVWSVESTDTGAAFRLPPSMKRTEYSDGMAGAAPDFKPSALDPEAFERLRQQGLNGEITQLGMIDRDPDAVYVAILVKVSDKYASKLIGNVMGAADIHSFSLSVVAYDEFRDSATFDELLGLVKPLMRAALEDNPE